VAHANAVDLPCEGVAGTGVGLEMMVCGCLHAYNSIVIYGFRIILEG
jgi:hypothetical protein